MIMNGVGVPKFISCLVVFSRVDGFCAGKIVLSVPAYRINWDIRSCLLAKYMAI